VLNLVQKPGGALLVGPDAVFTSRRAQIVTLAARHAVPANPCLHAAPSVVLAHSVTHKLRRG